MENINNINNINTIQQEEQTMEKICANCGCVIEDDNYITNGTEYLCADCKEEMAFCCFCGELTDRNEYKHIDSGEPMCEDCYEDTFATCDECGKVFYRDYLTWTAEETAVCDDCLDKYYYICDRCDGYYNINDDHLSDDNRCICPDCAEHYGYAECNDCGHIDYIDEMYWSDRDDAYYCEDCFNDNALVHEYGYKPDPDFHHDGNGSNRYYGIELEIDNGQHQQDCAEALLRHSENETLFYLKEDGSLSSHSVGIEIVTHPCGVQYHMNSFPWDEIAATALRYGYRSHETNSCGLHIHIGRDELAPDMDDKLVVLFDRHWLKLAKFSRRDSYHIDTWAARPDIDLADDDDEQTLKVKTDVYKKCSGRYKAVNLRNSNTIEIRIFRGTLKRDTIIASIQLVDTLIEYCESHSLEEIAMSEWADVTHSDFAELNNYLEQRGI